MTQEGKKHGVGTSKGKKNESFFPQNIYLNSMMNTKKNLCVGELRVPVQDACL